MVLTSVDVCLMCSLTLRYLLVWISGDFAVGSAVSHVPSNLTLPAILEYGIGRLASNKIQLSARTAGRLELLTFLAVRATRIGSCLPGCLLLVLRGAEFSVTEGVDLFRAGHQPGTDSL